MEETVHQSTTESYKKLYRNKGNAVLAGVASGLADYFEVPSIFPRLIFILAGLSGFGILAYIAMWIIVPENPSLISEQTFSRKSELSSTILRIGGGLLVLFGVYELLENLNIYWFEDAIDYASDFAIPVFLIILGSLIVYFSMKKNYSNHNEVNMNQAEPKRLFRVMKDRMIAGVCSGLGYYFNLDPVLIRVLFVISVFISFGATLLVYLVLALATPKDYNF